MPLQKVGTDVVCEIIALVEDLRPVAAVCSAWAKIVALRGKRLVREHGLGLPQPSRLAEDSYARGVYYLSAGYACPYPGNFACTADATYPIWPFPVSTAWKGLLRQNYRRFPTQRDIGTCDVYRSPYFGLGLKAEIQVANGKLDGRLAEALGNTAAFTGLLDMCDYRHRILGDVFKVGPYFVALPEPPLCPQEASRDPSIMAVDVFGTPLVAPANHWEAGHLSNWRPVTAPILRRVSPNCVAVIARTDDPGKASATNSDFAYCSGVVWWHQKRGLRVRQFGPPARPDTTAGWALPPLDTKRKDAVVCVLKWGSEWPYPDLAQLTRDQETQEQAQEVPRPSKIRRLCGMCSIC